LAFRTYEAYQNVSDAPQRALALLERARGLDPHNVHHQLASVRFLILGGYYEDAKSALAKVQSSPEVREPDLAEEVTELRKILARDRQGEEVRRYEAISIDQGSQGLPREDRLAALERELEQAPGAIGLYEELARALAADGRYQDAIDWSDRAMGQ